ncbi:MAG TPA: hypothetical protein VGY55_03145 [Pirellulales bacterium]|jgi:hypothetical protein|nr:hypothetical protein [Pirellulales bacterium]
MQSSPWRIDGHTARLESATFRAEIDLLNPSAGVSRLEVRGAAISDGALFRVKLPPFSSAYSVGEVSTSGASGQSAHERSLDFFSRGNDLVAVYGEAAGNPFRAQIYWRLLPALPFDSADNTNQSIAALELILSIQTSLLDSDPALAVETNLATNKISQLTESNNCRFVDLPIPSASELVNANLATGCFVFRPANARMVYIEMVHPADFRHSTLERVGQSGTLRLAHRLFAERLEKGVILRSRIRGIFAAAETDLAAISRAYQEFAESEPPLTA